MIIVHNWSGVGTKDNLRISQVGEENIRLEWLRSQVQYSLSNILLLDYLFSPSKASDSNIAIFANYECLWKTRLNFQIVSYLGIKHVKMCVTMDQMTVLFLYLASFCVFDGTESDGLFLCNRILQNVILLE